ncbi:MAG: hypothetical protein AAGL69_02685 [Pseudomonadota bacterium]
MKNEDSETIKPESEGARSLFRAEQYIIRLTFWQTVLSVVGVIIAILALYAALNESAAVRQQTEAAVWPFIQLTIENYDTGGAAGFSFALTNAGVGPARMHNVRVAVDDVVVRDWTELVAIVDGDPNAAVNRNYISKRVLRPDASVVVFGTTDTALARKLVHAFNKPRGALTFCYCSIFDQCWLADSRKDLQAPEQVQECPDFGDETYIN